MNKHHSARSRQIRHKKTGGYIVIIVLLLTAVLLMLGLSLATRTTEEVYQSGQEADTTRVFNAAETGIEAALYTIQGDSGTVPNDSAIHPLTETIFGGAAGVNSIESDTKSNLDVTAQRASDFDINIAQGEVLTLVWKPGTTINWTYANCAAAPAVIVTLYNTVGPTASHIAYNPMSDGSTQCANKGTSFANATFVDATHSRIVLNDSTFDLVPALDAVLRIRPLYADGAFTVTGSSAIKLISQASDTSGGTSAETRKIQVIRTEPAAPSVFDYAVFSGGSLTK